MTGHIKFFLSDKGHGYIRVEETYEEFYFQSKHLKSQVKNGDQVYFDLEEDRHGLYATNIIHIPEG